MRLGTMDDSDIFAEVEGDEQAGADMPVAMPSPVQEGDIEEGEMVEGEEQDEEGEEETFADETRGVSHFQQKCSHSSRRGEAPPSVLFGAEATWVVSQITTQRSPL